MLVALYWSLTEGVAEQRTLSGAFIPWAQPEPGTSGVFLQALGTAHHLAVVSGREGAEKRFQEASDL